MKKVLIVLISIVFAVSCTVSFSACKKKTGFEPRVAIIAGTEEEYGFAVRRAFLPSTLSKITGSEYTTADVIVKVNEVIEELEDDMEALRDYYMNIYEKNPPGVCPIDIPDVNAKEGTAGTLIVGTEADFGIFEFAVESVGDIKGIVMTSSIPNKYLTGLDIAIMILTADKLNMKIQVREIFFDDLPDALLNGTIHVIAAAFSITEGRSLTMTFSDSYYSATQTILSNKSAKLTTLKSLRGKVVAVQAGSTSEELIINAINDGTLLKGSKEKSLARVKSYGRIANAYGDLKRGNIHAIVVDCTIAMLLATQW